MINHFGIEFAKNSKLWIIKTRVNNVENILVRRILHPELRYSLQNKSENIWNVKIIGSLNPIYVISHRLWRNVSKSIIVKKKEKEKKEEDVLFVYLDKNFTLDIERERLRSIGCFTLAIVLFHWSSTRKGNNNIIWTESLIIRLCDANLTAFDIHHYSYARHFYMNRPTSGMLLESKSMPLRGWTWNSGERGCGHDIGYQRDYEHVPTPVRWLVSRLINLKCHSIDRNRDKGNWYAILFN